MTVPRRILPGETVMVTSCAVNRALRFVPTRRVVPTILYCFAYTLSRKEFRGIAVHEFVWMSNHFHIVLTAADDSLPDFVQDLNSLMSRALNALRGTGGSNIEKHYNITVETDAGKASQKSGRRVLGMRQVAKQYWNALPSQREDMFGPEPAAAGTSKWARIEYLQQRRVFIEAYRAALARYRDGDHEVVFPLGTRLMRRRFKVKCGDALAC